MLKTKNFILTESEAENVSAYLRNILSELKPAPENIDSVCRSMETALSSWLEKGLSPNGGQLSIETCRQKIFVTLCVQGKESNPFAQGIDELYGDASFCQPLLAAMEEGVGYSYSKGKNRVSAVLKPIKATPFAFAAIASILALILGILTVRLVPEHSDMILEQFATPLFDAFTRLISSFGTPLLFLTIAWAFYYTLDFTRLGLIGKQAAKRFAFHTAHAALLGGLAAFLFTGISIWPTGSGSMETEPFLQLLLSFVPDSILDPFQNGSIVQIIFLGSIAGIALTALRRRAAITGQLARQGHAAARKIWEALAWLVPFFLFLSIYRLILGGTAFLLAEMLKAAGAYLLCLCLICAFYMMALKLRAGETPFAAIKKPLPDFLRSLAAGSSEILVRNLEARSDQLGIHKRLARLCIPFGIFVFKPAATLQLILVTVFAAKAFEISLPLPMLLLILLSAAIMAPLAPSKPGALLVCSALLFLQTGIPLEAMGLAVTANIFLDALSAGFDTLFIETEALYNSKIIENQNIVQ